MPHNDVFGKTKQKYYFGIIKLGTCHVNEQFSLVFGYTSDSCWHWQIWAGLFTFLLALADLGWFVYLLEYMANCQLTESQRNELVLNYHRDY